MLLLQEFLITQNIRKNFWFLIIHNVIKTIAQLNKICINLLWFVICELDFQVHRLCLDWVSFLICSILAYCKQCSVLISRRELKNARSLGNFLSYCLKATSNHRQLLALNFLHLHLILLNSLYPLLWYHFILHFCLPFQFHFLSDTSWTISCLCKSRFCFKNLIYWTCPQYRFRAKLFIFWMFNNSFKWSACLIAWVV